MQEIWKDIEGYEGKYQISNFGRARILKELVLQTNRDGYVTINLNKNGKGKRVTVHRLVAKHFISNPENKDCVNHKDCNRTNNNVNNLEWCTYKENTQYSIKYGNSKDLIKRLESLREKQKKIVNQYSLNGEFLNQFKSLAEAAQFIGKGKSSGPISNCCRGIFKTAYGYKWKYARSGEFDE